MHEPDPTDASRAAPRSAAPDVTDAAAIAAILADPIRAGILRCWPTDPHCVCEMAAALAPARTTSATTWRAYARPASSERCAMTPTGATSTTSATRRRCAKARAALVDVLAMTTIAVRRVHVPLWLTVLVGSALWIVAWFLALPLSTWLAFDVLGLDPASQLGQAVAFFLYDVPKVLLLLTGIVTLVSFMRSFVSPERVRLRWQAGTRRSAPSPPPASGSSPRSARARPCRCSSASSRRACRSASRSRSSSPRPWSTRSRSSCCGASSGRNHDRLHRRGAPRRGLRRPAHRPPGPRAYVEDYVWKVRAGSVAVDFKPTIEDRLRDAWRSTRDIVGRVWPYVIVGIGIGAAHPRLRAH